MSQNSNNHNYKATLDINYKKEEATIAHLLPQGEPRERFEETIEIFTNTQENYKISLDFSPKNNQLILNSLILEELELKSTDLESFRIKAERHLLSYFNRIKFVYSSSPQDIDYNITFYEPRSSKGFSPISSDSYIDNSSTQITGPFNRINYAQLASTVVINGDINRINEWIGHYLKIQECNDPVLRLVMSSWLYELIGKSLGRKEGRKEEVENKFYIFYYKDSEEDILKIERLAKSARNLVSHGFVDKSYNLLELKTYFDTTEESYQLDMNDKKHMDLVRWAANRFLSVIQDYIISQLPCQILQASEEVMLEILRRHQQNLDNME